MPSSRGFSVQMKKNFQMLTTEFDMHVMQFVEKVAKKYELSEEDLKEMWKEHETNGGFSCFTVKKKKGVVREGENGSVVKKQMPFIVFSNMHRSAMKEQNPHAKHTDISKLLGQQWQALTKEEKAQYYINNDIPTLSSVPERTETIMSTIDEETLFMNESVENTSIIPAIPTIPLSSEFEQEANNVDNVLAPTVAPTVTVRPRKTPSAMKSKKKERVSSENASAEGGGGGGGVANEVASTSTNVWSSKSLKELRQYCQEQGLAVSGNKAELIQRLEEKLAKSRVPTSIDSIEDEDNEEDRLVVSPTQLDTADSEEEEEDNDEESPFANVHSDSD